MPCAISPKMARMAGYATPRSRVRESSLGITLRGSQERSTSKRGGVLRTASLLHYLARTRPVDLIVFRQPGAPDPAAHLPLGLVREVFVLNLPPNRRDAATRVLRNASRVARGVPPLVDRFAGFEGQLAEIMKGRRYGVGIIEHFWCAPYGDVISSVCSHTVLD